MPSAATPWPPPSRLGEPVWEVAEFFPEQGRWTESQYLALTTSRLVEFDNGIIEVLPVPTKTHQIIVLFLRDLLKAFLAAQIRGGLVLVAPYRLKIPTGKFREPDVLYMTSEQNRRAAEEFTTMAEIVMEVVSTDDADRDYVAKRADYASAGIPEYWIIDREKQVLIVLRLIAGQYVEHGSFGTGEVATSSLLAGFTVKVDEVLSLGLSRSE